MSKQIFEKAIEKWGVNSQLDMVIEECSELIQAICKLKRIKENSLDNLMEEVADVEIMLTQLRIIIGNDKLIDFIKSEKIKRLEVRISG